MTPSRILYVGRRLGDAFADASVLFDLTHVGLLFFVAIWLLSPYWRSGPFPLIYHILPAFGWPVTGVLLIIFGLLMLHGVVHRNPNSLAWSYACAFTTWCTLFWIFGLSIGGVFSVILAPSCFARMVQVARIKEDASR